MKKNISISLIIFVIIFILCFIFFKKDKKEEYLVNQDEIQVPVLIYHHFYKDEDKEKYEPAKDYSVRISVFEEQLKYLYNNGYKSLTPDELLCWKEEKCEINPKSVLITIDDGQKSVLELAKPILKKYGYKAISFVISSRMPEKKENYDPSKYQYISKEELKENDTIKWGSHSHKMHEMIDNTKKLYTMSYDEIEKDVSESRKILNTEYFAFPFNTYNSDFINALDSAGYKLAFRGQSRKTTRKESRYMTSRIFVSEDMEKFKSIFETNKYNQEEI